MGENRLKGRGVCSKREERNKQNISCFFLYGTLDTNVYVCAYVCDMKAKGDFEGRKKTTKLVGIQHELS